MSAAARRGRVAEIQRSRLLAAVVRELDERSDVSLTVAQITARARVSRRTFYELFANCDACLVAVLDDAQRSIEDELAAAGLYGLSWRERVRVGLWLVLCFLDREPALARACAAHMLRGGDGVLERREKLLRGLAGVVDEGRREISGEAGCTALTAEGVVGAALAIVHARLLRRDPEPLSALHGDLCAMVVLPYLGATAARQEQTRRAPSVCVGAQPVAASDRDDPLKGVAMRMTYRTVRVLEGIAEHPGCSNREAAQHAGIGDQGQISKLMHRLQAHGLVINQGASARGNGEPNAWRLTARGEMVTRQVTRSLHMTGTPPSDEPGEANEDVQGERQIAALTYSWEEKQR